MDVFRQSKTHPVTHLNCHRSLLSCWLCTFRRCSWNESQRTVNGTGFAFFRSESSTDLTDLNWRSCWIHKKWFWGNDLTLFGIVETYPYFQGIPQFNMFSKFHRALFGWHWIFAALRNRTPLRFASASCRTGSWIRSMNTSRNIPKSWTIFCVLDLVEHNPVAICFDML